MSQYKGPTCSKHLLCARHWLYIASLTPESSHWSFAISISMAEPTGILEVTPLAPNTRTCEWELRFEVGPPTACCSEGKLLTRERTCLLSEPQGFDVRDISLFVLAARHPDFPLRNTSHLWVVWARPSHLCKDFPPATTPFLFSIVNVSLLIGSSSQATYKNVFISLIKKTHKKLKRVGKDVEELELLYIASGAVNWFSPCGEEFTDFLKMKHRIAIWSSIRL